MLPWLAQQRNPAMSPHTRGKKQAPVTLKNISGEKPTKPRGRAEGEENGWQNLARKETERANKSHDRCSQLLGMRMPKTADLRHLRRS